MSLERALTLIDAAHTADPAGRELDYATAMTAWVERLVPTPSPALRLAARAQHLERWTLPRSAYPMDRPGYHAWRIAQYRRQGERAEALCREAGITADTAATVAQLVGKRLATTPDGQALEDAACLVFLEHEIAGFASQHQEYPREKFIDILRKTARKMSPAGRAAAAGLDLAEPFRSLLHDAIA